MRGLVAVLVSALMTSAAWAESPVLVLRSTGWMTEFDMLSFSIYASFEDAEVKKRDPIWQLGSIIIS